MLWKHFCTQISNYGLAEIICCTSVHEFGNWSIVFIFVIIYRNIIVVLL